ncbi:hypothetical protein ZORO111902_04305 [Zobellia roscoffensis]
MVNGHNINASIDFRKCKILTLATFLLLKVSQSSKNNPYPVFNILILLLHLFFVFLNITSEK